MSVVFSFLSIECTCVIMVCLLACHVVLSSRYFMTIVDCLSIYKRDKSIAKDTKKKFFLLSSAKRFRNSIPVESAQVLGMYDGYFFTNTYFRFIHGCISIPKRLFSCQIYKRCSTNNVSIDDNNWFTWL